MVQTSADDGQSVGHRIKLNFIQKLENTRKKYQQQYVIEKIFAKFATRIWHTSTGRDDSRSLGCSFISWEIENVCIDEHNILSAGPLLSNDE